jgi:hypothetical protein
MLEGRYFIDGFRKLSARVPTFNLSASTQQSLLTFVVVGKIYFCAFWGLLGQTLGSAGVGFMLDFSPQSDHCC